MPDEAANLNQPTMTTDDHEPMKEASDEDDVTLTEYTVENRLKQTENEIPEYIYNRVENLLGEHPMTNQRVILDTADWWLDNCGNCAIYRWCIHRLDALENDSVRMQTEVYSDALKQAKDIFGDEFADFEVA